MFTNNLECIHSAVFAKAFETPSATALVSRNADGTYNYKTYAELVESALKIASTLKEAGIKAKDLVSIVLPKGMNQVFCTLGIQAVGAAYVPVGIHQPMERMHKIFDAAKISAIVTDAEHAEQIRKENHVWKVIVVDEALQSAPMPKDEIVEDPSLLAYIIFTSGTTGVPKGVMISHRGASNTIRDINERFNLTANDACMAISELDFDLSVYDIFGMLSLGGKVIVLSEETKKEASIWKQIASDQKVTLWNSVPALFEMFTIVAGDKASSIPLKTVMLSGDWIPLPLFGATKKLWPSVRFISLGGATEVSIWSVWYEVHELQPEWKSIPYGKALLNQKIKVMDESGKECATGEAGELWIGGIGVAEGYLNQPELTQERFPIENGERWYRTGDKVRMMADGNSEFLGRLDTQIKLGGFRIELGEIENVIKKKSNIVNAAAVVVENGAKKEIVAAVIPALNKEKIAKYDYKFIESHEDDSLSDRINAVAALIHDIRSNVKVIPEKSKNAFALWSNWLFKNGFESIRPAIKSEFSKELNRAENVELLQNVLVGNRPETDLLSNKFFAPEKLLCESAPFKTFIGKVVTLAASSEAKTIAFLNARSGLGVREFLSRYEKSGMEITLFDESTGMLDEARDTLRNWRDCLKFKQLDLSACVQNLESFDLVIDAGFLHTYNNPKDALAFAYMILKKSGTLMALDFENFDPVAIVSSAVLENGFAKYTRLRRFTSLLTDEEWESIFKELPFATISLENNSHFVQTIVAKKASDAKEILGNEFETYLKTNLVPYMIPSRTEVFVKFPLTANAKVDRKTITAYLKKTGDANVNENYEGREADLASIWKSLLSLDKIDRHANFFEIGGDSLLATRFIEKIHTQFGVEISLREFFENAELNELAQIFEERISALGDIEEGEI
ncbi:amino acid adenylation domain-containing protein [Fibrobacter sp. UWB12]|uniref:amino acid adenylation domain-containing protein n=1 Tax=Fibrobacter sp. UWB12 TaxID=1896203 RepID=UPI00091497E1|nr:amino acid adenylation domain-containing protein [Fibrobacter sp. UWB12]SHK48369.1 dihydroaeruginoic acid synthetase [Fibrobacter sp. UWB12]